MEQNDVISRCLTAGDEARVVVTFTTDVAREAARRHGAAGHAAVALARASSAGLLLATLTKGRERVTLQVLGHGAFRGIVVDAASDGDVRAFISNPRAFPGGGQAGQRLSISDAVGRDGSVAVVRDLGLREQVRGEVALCSGEIDEDVERYLTVSEQIPSALGCDAVLGSDQQVSVAAGVLVQTMPGSTAAPLLLEARRRLRQGALYQALRDDPAVRDGQDVLALVRALLPDLEGVRVLDTRPVRFNCPCSSERAARTLALLGEEDLKKMVVEDGGAEVTCDFCRERYCFTAAELERVRQQVRKDASPPS